MGTIYLTGVVVGLVLTFIVIIFMLCLDIKSIYKDYAGSETSFSGVVEDVRGYGYDFDWVATCLGLLTLGSMVWPFTLMLVILFTIGGIVVYGLNLLVHKIMSKNKQEG